MESSDTEGAAGFADQTNLGSEYNVLYFQVTQILAMRNKCVPVRVVDVESAGELALTGLLAVQPLVNQLSADGVAIPHGIINNIRYFRITGGNNGIIMDPAVGDIGLMLCADRDMSLADAAQATLRSDQDSTVNPGSMRRDDMVDGVYFGGLLNAIPTQYVQFNATGIKIFSPHKIELVATDEIKLVSPVVTMNASTSATITAGQFTVNGPSQFNGAINSTGTITAPNVVGTTDVTGGGKSLKTHLHTGVQTGGGISGPPQ